MYSNISGIGLLTALALVSSASATCYNPDGSASGDTPCVAGDGVNVFCCPAGSRCLANPGPLCEAADGTYSRGSCTVENWASSAASTACPLFCLGTSTDNSIDRCTNALSLGRFCCGYDADRDLCSCASNNNTFHLGSYHVPVISIIASAPSSSSTPLSSSSTQSPTDSAAESSTSTTSSISLEFTSAGPSSSTTSTPSTALSATSSSSVSVALASSSTTTRTGAGIRPTVAVENLLGVGALGFVGLFW